RKKLAKKAPARRASPKKARPAANAAIKPTPVGPPDNRKATAAHRPSSGRGPLHDCVRCVLAQLQAIESRRQRQGPQSIRRSNTSASGRNEMASQSIGAPRLQTSPISSPPPHI